MISLKRWPKLERLREKLKGKAKAERQFRFYCLYDKVYRSDVLEAAYAQCRSNDGAPGVDGQSFDDIKAYGVERFLTELADELKSLRYQPAAVRRVLIPKEGQPGKFRPLGIPTIKDRVVQQAVKLLLEPIFEVDFTENAYAYRAERCAQDAVSETMRHLRAGHTDVVDADLSKYFDTIPHDQLLRSVERRVADPKVLWLIRHWLKVPVHETNASKKVVISGGEKTKAGTPQGGVISPLLANIYFRRFLLAWKENGYEREFASRIVNYADDFVILCKKRAGEAMNTARRMLTQLGLTLNETKTRVCRAGQEPFNFLGYTFEHLHRWGGSSYLGVRPSDASAKGHREDIRKLTEARNTTKPAKVVVREINQVVSGYWHYFNLGTSGQLRWILDTYTRERVRRWMCRKHQKAKNLKALTREAINGLTNGLRIPKRTL